MSHAHRTALALIAALALALPISVPAAQAQGAHECSGQLIRSVEARLPRLNHDIPVQALSCAGIVQIYFLLDQSNRGEIQRNYLRQRINAVFRREGLIN
ncbi:hypothetical protein E2K80_17570 [Rhodophyticola sp. CCM32]|uniref:hypothetical protein n=1 Tax=Rhodophyticola sp. CCM32 TaxID=2916397 RepID=UPI00107F63D3|nr:hypothetical protein [Rhodophyticola sp. CCM32]QBY02324.1 hypothetical protein E2K80_17570 [Rhodophyticola sp. CCM32]